MYNLLSQHFSGKISKELIVFLVSMVPLLELRGSILAAGLIKMSFFPSYIAAVLGNMPDTVHIAVY